MKNQSPLDVEECSSRAGACQEDERKKLAFFFAGTCRAAPWKLTTICDERVFAHTNRKNSVYRIYEKRLSGAE